MKKGLTEIVFLLDESGSMFRLKEDTIKGYNYFLERQKEAGHDAYITAISFSSGTKLLQKRIHISKANPIDKSQYCPSGSTSLLDALGEAINRTRFAQQDDGANAPEKTVFIIITDGEENSSQEYEYGFVNRMIEHKKNEDGWHFLFLGANIDVGREISRLGIMPEMAAEYLCDSKGTEINFEAVRNAVSSLISNGTISEDWKTRIEEYLAQSKGE